MYTTCTEQPVVILWFNWFKNECFWNRFNAWNLDSFQAEFWKTQKPAHFIVVFKIQTSHLTHLYKKGSVHKLCRLKIGNFWPSPPPLRRHSLWTAPKVVWSISGQLPGQFEGQFQREIPGTILGTIPNNFADNLSDNYHTVKFVIHCADYGTERLFSLVRTPLQIAKVVNGRY